jgi:hypothetical protein
MHFEDAVIAAAGLGDKVRFIYVHLYYTSISKQNQHDARLSALLGIAMAMVLPMGHRFCDCRAVFVL